MPAIAPSETAWLSAPCVRNPAMPAPRAPNATTRNSGLIETTVTPHAKSQVTTSAGVEPQAVE
jgi:hypothetical protein